MDQSAAAAACWLVAKLGRLRPDHLAHDPSRHPKLAANRLDRLVLGEIRPTDLRDRLHYQHPQPGPRIPHGSHCGPAVPGVLIACRFTSMPTCRTKSAIPFTTSSIPSPWQWTKSVRPLKVQRAGPADAG